jgi:hypothetical protein
MAPRFAILAGLAAAAFSHAASAMLIDLTTPGSATVGGAILQTADIGTSGTGSLNSFVRIQHTGTEQGYNTSNQHPAFDEKTGNWTHDLLISDVGTEILAGVTYLEFFLDVNESGNDPGRYISLDQVRIYTSPTPSQNTTNLASLGTLIYDMNATESNNVKLDATLTNGSGSGDMRMLIPVSNLSSALPTDYLYLYSSFGALFPSDNGFEEWATQGPAIPAPGSFALLGIGGVLIARRRR